MKRRSYQKLTNDSKFASSEKRISNNLQREEVYFRSSVSTAVAAVFPVFCFHLQLDLAFYYFSAADAMTCYFGQEPSVNSTGLLWYITEADPADCTVYRPGGLNTQPLLTKLSHSTTIGGDRDALSLLHSKDRK